MPDITIGAWLVSVGTALFTLYTWLLTRNASFYSTFDALYQDMLKLGLDHPFWRDPAKTLTYDESFFGNDRVQYETYAFMMLNVCETIADSLDLYPTSHKRWYTVIERVFDHTLDRMVLPVFAVYCRSSELSSERGNRS